MKSRRTHATEISQNSDSVFFDLYSSVDALCHETNMDNEAVGLFLASKQDLDRAISDASLTTDVDRLASLHAIKGLLHWLHPSYPEFSRKENARMMLNHAREAVKMSEDKPGCIDSYAVGLFVELRISSFLMKSQLSDEGQLFEAREKAHSFVESMEYMPEKIPEQAKRYDLLGLVLDGLGFSYYQVEGDRRIALHYLTKAHEYLSIARNELQASLKTDDSYTRLLLVNCIAAVALWDIGICHESEAEQRDAAEAIAFFKKARASYSKSLTTSKASPWLIYKALSAYGVAGTFVREHELRADLSDSEHKQLVSKAISFGEEASSYLKTWSTLETDILGGVANALFYQKLAELSDGREKRACIERSLELISRAEVAAKSREGSRFSDANFGDIYLRGALYYYNMSSEDAPKREDFLEMSLKNCDLSQKHFDDDRHRNRMVDSLILGAKIRRDLMKFFSSIDEEKANRFRAEGREKRQKSISICRRYGWETRAKETLELAADFGEEA